MAKAVISEKLESLRRCLGRIREKCPESAQALARDIDAQDILVLNLSRAVQLCVDIGAHLISHSNRPAPQTMGETFTVLADMGLLSETTALAMRRAVGFRNIAVHGYENLNITIVYKIATDHLADFRAFAMQIEQHVAGRAD